MDYLHQYTKYNIGFCITLVKSHPQKPSWYLVFYLASAWEYLLVQERKHLTQINRLNPRFPSRFFSWLHGAVGVLFSSFLENWSAHMATFCILQKKRCKSNPAFLLIANLSDGVSRCQKRPEKKIQKYMWWIGVYVWFAVDHSNFHSLFSLFRFCHFFRLFTLFRISEDHSGEAQLTQ